VSDPTKKYGFEVLSVGQTHLSRSTFDILYCLCVLFIRQELSTPRKEKEGKEIESFCHNFVPKFLQHFPSHPKSRSQRPIFRYHANPGWDHLILLPSILVPWSPNDPSKLWNSMCFDFGFVSSCVMRPALVCTKFKSWTRGRICSKLCDKHDSSWQERVCYWRYWQFLSEDFLVSSVFLERIFLWSTLIICK